MPGSSQSAHSMHLRNISKRHFSQTYFGMDVSAVDHFPEVNGLVTVDQPFSMGFEATKMVLRHSDNKTKDLTRGFEPLRRRHFAAEY